MKPVESGPIAAGVVVGPVVRFSCADLPSSRTRSRSSRFGQAAAIADLHPNPSPGPDDDSLRDRPASRLFPPRNQPAAALLFADVHVLPPAGSGCAAASEGPRGGGGPRPAPLWPGGQVDSSTSVHPALAARAARAAAGTASARPRWLQQPQPRGPLITGPHRWWR